MYQSGVRPSTAKRLAHSLIVQVIYEKWEIPCSVKVRVPARNGIERKRLVCIWLSTRLGLQTQPPGWGFCGLTQRGIVSSLCQCVDSQMHARRFLPLLFFKSLVAGVSEALKCWGAWGGTIPGIVRHLWSWRVKKKCTGRSSTWLERLKTRTVLW